LILDMIEKIYIYHTLSHFFLLSTDWKNWSSFFSIYFNCKFKLYHCNNSTYSLKTQMLQSKNSKDIFVTNYKFKGLIC
jgi:hypothetical protein